jgi:hypothetical protein
MEGSGCGLYTSTIKAFVSWECENPGKTLVRIVSIPLGARKGKKRNA